MATKRELQEENDTLRHKLEEAYDVIGDALGFEDDRNDDDDDESDASDSEEEE